MVYLSGKTDIRNFRTGSYFNLGTDVKPIKEIITWDELARNVSFDADSIESKSMAAEIFNSLFLLTSSPVNIRISSFGKTFDYLLLYPNLYQLIIETCVKARDTFGPETQLSLEYEQDPESDHSSLALFLRQWQYPENFIVRLDELNEEFIGKWANIPGDYFILTDFQNPQ
jgi:hypothetical protein